MSNSIDSRSTPTVSPTDYAKFDPETIHQKLNASLSRPQLNNDGSIRHFLGVEGLSKAQLQAIIAKAETFFDDNGQLINRPELEGYTVMNLFLSRQRARVQPLKSPKSVLVPMCSISILSAPVPKKARACATPYGIYKR